MTHQLILVLAGVLLGCLLFLVVTQLIEFRRPQPKYPIAPSEDELNQRAEIYRSITANYPLCSTMFRCFPAGISVQINQCRPILRIDGNEIEPNDWEHNLYFLEFLKKPDYLVEIHINRLPLNSLVVGYLMKLLHNNWRRLCVLSIDDCRFSGNIAYRLDFSFLAFLTTFKLNSTNLSSKGTDFLIAHLPRSLRVLEVSVVGDYRSICRFTLANLAQLEQLSLVNIESDIADAVLSMPNLSMLSLSSSPVCPILERLRLPVMWKKLVLNNLLINRTLVPVLLNLPMLQELDLTGCNVTAGDIVALISQNLSCFPCLKRVNLSGLFVNHNIEFTDELIDSGIKFIFFRIGYFWVSNYNWNNSMFISTGILIDIARHPTALHELFARKSNLQHITFLDVQNFSVESDLKLLLRLLSSLPALNSIALSFVDLPLTSESDLLVNTTTELLSIKIRKASSSERFLEGLCQLFPNLKELTITLPTLFKPFSFSPLKQLESLTLNCTVCISEVAAFFTSIAALPKLRHLQFQLGCRARRRFSWVVPKEFLALSQLKVRKMYVEIASINGIPRELEVLFSKLPHLTDLSIDTRGNNTNLQAILSSFNSMRRLRHLSINNCLSTRQLNRITKQLATLPLLTDLTLYLDKWCDNTRLLRAARKMPFLTLHFIQ